MEGLNNTISSKFRRLLSYLTRTRMDFEMVADEIEDTTLKTAFNGLSAESSQYAMELSIQLKALGIHYEPDSGMSQLEISNESPLGNAVSDNDAGKGNEVMNICCSRENYLIKAYREILNEIIHFPRLREVMLYQLDALICGFMKIKLLNATRFS